MDAKELEDRLRSLSGSQQSIESLSEYCVRNVEDAEAVVRLWQTECERSSPDKRLNLLYLANDILQKCRKHSPKYSRHFVAVLPRVVRHLFKGGPDKVRKSLGRLVGIWEDRKVLEPRALKAMKEYLKREGRGPKSGAGAVEREDASRKRPRPSDSLVRVAREAEAAAGKTAEWRAKHQKLVEQGIQSENMQLLEIIGRQLVFYGTALNGEIQSRRKYADLLRSTLHEQEQAERQAQDILHACKIHQEKVARSVGSLTELAQRENYSPTSPEAGLQDNSSPQLMSSIPTIPIQSQQGQIIRTGLHVGQPPQISAHSGPVYTVQPQMIQHTQASVPQATVGLKQEKEASHPPMPPLVVSTDQGQALSTTEWKTQFPPPSFPQGFDIGPAPQPAPVTSSWHVQQYSSPNADLEINNKVQNHVATGQELGGTVVSNPLVATAQVSRVCCSSKILLSVILYCIAVLHRAHV